MPKASESHRSSGFFQLRTPLLPIDALLGWGADTQRDDPAADATDEAARRRALRQQLRRWVREPRLRSALLIASPSLDASLPIWMEQPDSQRGQRIERSLVRYFCRMAARPTPFGLFAGVSLGHLGKTTRLVFPPHLEERRRTRLDMGWVTAWLEQLRTRPDLAEHWTYRPNASLYRVAGRLRYIETRAQGAHFLKAYLLTVADSDAYVDQALQLAADGVTRQALVEGLCRFEPNLEPAQGREFIDQLIRGQLLVPCLAAPLTGVSPWQALRQRVGDMPQLAATARQMDEISESLHRLDAMGTHAPPEAQRRLCRQLQGLGLEGHDASKLLQVDLYREAPELHVAEAQVAQLRRAVEALNRFDMVGRQDRLQPFRSRFIERYGERRVPLLEALDDEIGIGYGASGLSNAGSEPLLQGLDIGSPAATPQVRWGAAQRYLLRRLSHHLLSGEPELVLSDEDIEQLSVESPPPLPGAFSITASLFSPASGRGLSWYLSAVLGPSGVRLMSRFCHGDRRLSEAVRDHLQQEEARDPEALFAEIVHLPENPRHANVVLRPLLRQYEIPYLGDSGAAVEEQLQPSQILVGVEDGRIQLRRAGDGRRIEPRLSNAHAYARIGGGLYRFLCDLQGQGVASPVRWEWGALRDAAHLPRVRLGQVVLSRARWCLDGAQLRQLSLCRESLSSADVRRLRRELTWPRFVVLEDGDIELPIDLDNPLCVDLLIDHLRRRPTTVVLEMLPAPDELVVEGAEGHFVHEMVLPFIRGGASDDDAGRRRSQPTQMTSPPLTTVEPARRSFLPGGNWLYVKLFASPSNCDRLLVDCVVPWLRRARSQELLDDWFFLRFDQPDWHLRLRFHCPEGGATLLPSLQGALAPYLADGTLGKMELDTYSREVERYGGLQGVELAEAIFRVDSDASLALLEALQGGALQQRWRLALLGIDSLLSGLAFDLEAKAFIAAELRRAFSQEHGVNIHLKKQLGQRFRTVHDELRSLLNGQDAAAWSRRGRRILAQHHRALPPLGEQLHHLARQGNLERPAAALASSYVHLHVNRLLRSTHRRQELVLYEFLYRLYQEARPRRGKPGARP